MNIKERREVERKRRQRERERRRRRILTAVAAAAIAAIAAGATLYFVRRAGRQGGGTGSTADTGAYAALSSEGITGSRTQESGSTSQTSEKASTASSSAGSTSAAAVRDGGALAMEEVQKVLDDYIDGKYAGGKESGSGGNTGVCSIYVKRADSEEIADVNASERLPSASLIKLYIAGCYLDQVEKGAINDSCEDSLALMIEDSDNDAANRLIDLLGMNTINDFIEAQGLSQTHLGRRMLEQPADDDNYTSAQDCGRTLGKILEGTYVSEDASARLLGYLEKQTRTGKIPAGVPEGIKTANKTGELTVSGYSVQSDAAIVCAPGGTYILTVMIRDGGGEGDMAESIKEISRLVYETIGTEEAMQTFDAQSAESAGDGTGTENADRGGMGR